MKKQLVLIALVVTTLLSLSKSHAQDSNGGQIFFSHESNGQDYISGFGVGLLFVNAETNVGFQLNTSLSNAEITSTDGYIEDFVAWEGGVKFGLFSDISIYAEVGIDLAELFFHDLRYDRHDYYYDDYSHGYYEYHDNIDAYFGVGFGVQLGPLKLEGISRLREIDSLYWESESELFTGFQVSLNF